MLQITRNQKRRQNIIVVETHQVETNLIKESYNSQVIIVKQKYKQIQIPQRKKTNQIMNINQVQDPSCYYHPQNRITSFCLHSNCLLPLCQSCVCIHRKQYPSGEHITRIIPFRQAKNIAIASIKSEKQHIIQNLQLFKSRFENFKDSIKTSIDQILNQILLSLQLQVNNIDQCISQRQPSQNSTQKTTNKSINDQLQVFQQKISSISLNSLKQIINHYQFGRVFNYLNKQLQYQIQYQQLKNIIKKFVKIKHANKKQCEIHTKESQKQHQQHYKSKKNRRQKKEVRYCSQRQLNGQSDSKHKCNQNMNKNFSTLNFSEESSLSFAQYQQLTSPSVNSKQQMKQNKFQSPSFFKKQSSQRNTKKSKSKGRVGIFVASSPFNEKYQKSLVQGSQRNAPKSLNRQQTQESFFVESKPSHQSQNLIFSEDQIERNQFLRSRQIVIMNRKSFNTPKNKFNNKNRLRLNDFQNINYAVGIKSSATTPVYEQCINEQSDKNDQVNFRHESNRNSKQFSNSCHIKKQMKIFPEQNGYLSPYAGLDKDKQNTLRERRLQNSKNIENCINFQGTNASPSNRTSIKSSIIKSDKKKDWKNVIVYSNKNDSKLNLNFNENNKPIIRNSNTQRLVLKNKTQKTNQFNTDCLSPQQMRQLIMRKRGNQQQGRSFNTHSKNTSTFQDISIQINNNPVPSLNVFPVPNCQMVESVTVQKIFQDKLKNF